MIRARLIAENYKNGQNMIKENNDQNTANTDYIPCYVAALYVQPDGCYAGEAGIDAWDEKRDAREYTGSLPVIAHPPCQLWGALAFVNYKRWGGEHNKPENDVGCFESALANVNRCGGVLEHPAKTRAFKKYDLEKPKSIGWQKSGNGWVCEVWQSAYGHRANKATWLYYVGKTPPFELRWERRKGSHQVGGAEAGRDTNKPTLSKREANATPIEFRDKLIKLALHSAAT
jgi:hypothetical protein